MPPVWSSNQLISPLQITCISIYSRYWCLVRANKIFLGVIAVVGTGVLVPLVVSQPAFAVTQNQCPKGTVRNSQGGCVYPQSLPSSNTSSSSSSFSCVGRQCTVSGSVTINGNNSSSSGGKKSYPPNPGHPGSQGGSSFRPPSGCSTIWSVANNNLIGQSPGFGSALTATCYGNGAMQNLNYYGIPTHPICNVVNGLAATTTTT